MVEKLQHEQGRMKKVKEDEGSEVENRAAKGLRARNKKY